MHRIGLKGVDSDARPMSEVSREYTVVLAHGPADAVAAAAVVTELRARRHAVLAVAIGGSDAPLMEACAKLGGRGLFVIAQGERFGPERAESLREVLRDLGVPMSRSLALALASDAAGASVFADRVVTLLRRIAPGPEVGRTLPPVPPRPPTKPVAAVAKPAAAVADGTVALASVVAPPPESRAAATNGYAVVPPSFDAEPRRADVPTSPGLANTAVVAMHAVGLRATPNRRRVVAAVAGLAAVGVLAWALLPRRPAEPIEVAPAARVAESETTAVPTSQPSATATPGSPPSVVAAPPPVASVVAIAPAQDAVPEAEDSEAIVSALRKREIRALDVFVVAPEAKKPADFAGASAYCKALEIAGIRDWRLPEIGELMSMSRAKMLRKGSFWSTTKGDTFGDFRLVLVIKRERISAIPSGWDGGRVACVRERA